MGIGRGARKAAGLDRPPVRGFIRCMTDKPPKPAKPLSSAAERALAEAAERRAARDRAAESAPKELHGRGGLDPARYGDWEIKGLTADF